MHRKQTIGIWYWRYKEIQDGVESEWNSVNKYEVLKESTVFETLTFDAFFKNIPSERPYLLTYGQSLKSLQENAHKNPKISNEVIQNGARILEEPVLKLRDVDRSQYTERNFLHKVMHPELKKLDKVIMAYLINEDSKYYENAKQRVQELST